MGCSEWIHVTRDDGGKTLLRCGNIQNVKTVPSGGSRALGCGEEAKCSIELADDIIYVCDSFNVIKNQLQPENQDE